MDKVLNLLYRIKEKPVMALGKISLERLDATISGYYMGVYECKGFFSSNILQGFQAFVTEKFNEKSAYNWATMIRQHSKDDEEAFDNFYKLLDDFLVENGFVPFSDNQAKDIYVFPYWKNKENTGDGSVS